MKLKKEVWSQKQFEEYYNKHFRTAEEQRLKAKYERVGDFNTATESEPVFHWAVRVIWVVVFILAFAYMGVAIYSWG